MIELIAVVLWFLCWVALVMYLLKCWELDVVETDRDRTWSHILKDDEDVQKTPHS